MTCEELRRYWEDEESGAMPLPSASVEWAEHAATCRECHSFVEERMELAKLLQLVRDSAPAVPAALDGAVLEDYRRLLSGQHRSAVPAPWTTPASLRGALSWAAAVGFACVVAYGGILLLLPPPLGHVAPRGHVAARVGEHQPAVAAQAAGNVRPAIALRPPSREIKPASASARQSKRAISVAQQDTSLPTRFQSLMYCDPFSCPGAMDVIRLELSSPVLGVTPASARTNGPVFADVLVGPDGIARGIRVEE